jgi:hypothetical protein
LRSSQFTAKAKNTTGPLTWDALQNMGVPISYDSFAARWDSEKEGPILKKLVQKFDGGGLTLRTKDSQPGKENNTAPSEVSKMAMSATKRGDLA